MANTLVPQDQLVDDNGAHIICPTLNHCGTQTSRAEVLLAWYRNVLGQQPTLSAQPPAVPVPGTWTTNDDVHHRMGFFTVPGMRDQFDMSAPGINHLAWEYQTLDDLLESVIRLKALGIVPVFCVNHRISFAAYYRDPDGMLIELLTDAFGDHAKSMEVQLNSDELRANPPGVPWDPELLHAALKAGASREELYERSLAGEFSPAGAPSHDLDGKIPAAE